MKVQMESWERADGVCWPPKSSHGETSTAISVTGGLEMAKQNYGLGEGWLDSDALAPLFVEEWEQCFMGVFVVWLGAREGFKIMKVVKKEKEARFSGCNADVSVWESNMRSCAREDGGASHLSNLATFTFIAAPSSSLARIQSCGKLAKHLLYDQTLWLVCSCKKQKQIIIKNGASEFTAF